MIILTNPKEFKLSNIELIILRFVETKTNKFLNMTITETADALYISVGAITHFVKKIGFANYKEFKKHVLDLKKNERKNDIYESNEHIENVNLFYIHSVEKTVNLLDINTADRVARKILFSKKVITFGIGSSWTPAREMANALNSLGLNAVVAQSTHDIVSWIDEPYKSDYVIVVFSKSMTSNEITFLHRLVKKHNIYLVVITSNKNLSSKDNVDVLLFETLEQDKRLFSLSSKISELFVSDILMMKIHAQLNKDKGEFYKEFQRVWRRRRVNE